MTLQEIGINFESRTKADLLIRAQQAVEHLLGAIQEAYYSGSNKVIGSHGGSGAIGALHTAVSTASGTLSAIIGTGPSAQYFRFLEYGVRPASSDPSAGPAYSRMPPALKMAEWTRLARLQVPQKFMPKDSVRHSKGKTAKHRRGSGLSGEAKGRLNWGFAIAVNRKKHGYKGLHIIIRVAERETANIRKILEQGAS